MKLFLVFVLLAVVVSGEGMYPEDSDVVMLTDDTFSAEMEKLSDHVFLVEFFAPWCGHCKSLKPAYMDAAKTLKNMDVKGVLAAVDATENEKIAQQFEIRGFPTILVFKGGKKIADYEGDRTAEGLIDAVETYALPLVQELEGKEAVEKFRKDRLLVVLAYFAEGTELAKEVFVKAADLLQEQGKVSFKYGLIKDEATAKEFKLDQSPAMRVYRAFEEEEKEIEFDFTKNFDEEKMAAFLTDLAFPILGEISPANYMMYEKRDLPIFWLFLPGHGEALGEDEDEEEKPEMTPEVLAKNVAVKKAVREAAAGFKTKASFVYLMGEDFKEHAENLGVSGGFPGGVLMQQDGEEKMKKFVVPEDFEWTAAALTKFLGQWVAGELVPSIKSEPEPTEEEMAAPVKPIVANTLDKMVYENDDDVFIMFYAPWCGHCKAVKPVFEALAKMMKDVKGLTFAKFDATANDGPDIVRGFPTFAFVKGEQKEHEISGEQIFDGERTKEGFIKYIKEHSSADLADLPPDLEVIQKWLDDFEVVKKEMETLVRRERKARGEEEAPEEEVEDEMSFDEEEEMLAEEAPQHEEL